MENRSITPETDFKQKIFFRIFFLLTIICPSQGEASRLKKKPHKFNFQKYFNGLEVS